MKYLTYNLEKENTGKDYYTHIKKFVDGFINDLPKGYKSILGDYKLFITGNKIEDLRTNYEYIYDLLFIGVVYKTYLPFALRISKLKTIIFTKLIKLRKVNGYTKEVSDRIRGILATWFLSETQSPNEFYNIDNDFELLEMWLEATNEFKEEVKRFRIFINYLKQKDEFEKEEIVEKLIKVTDSFIEKGEKELSVYTKNVNKFIEENLNNYKWKEDYIFCGRKEVEYHLSMVGAELLNRAFKQKYELTKKRALLLPACMREKSAELCKAKKMGLDLLCTGCSDTCKINNIKKKVKKYECETYIIPHSSDFSNWLKKWENTTEIGVIGVACPLNLMQGRLELRALNIPSQCVLLDYCGCKNHWCKDGIATGINNTQLLSTVKA
jgi:hypothetical protein